MRTNRPGWRAPKALVAVLAAGGGLIAVAAVSERDARACGGCFHPPTQTASDITDERMLLSVSPTQTTLYDQIRYSGSPTSFAWVLPIHGTVTVGLSADVLFDSVDTLTATQIVPPEPNCPAAPARCPAPPRAAFADASTASPGGGVTVIKQENVGPYATVQLHATDSSALNTWLAQNGFAIPADVTPVIAQYVTEKFDFLAMKLLPNQGVQAMRPVRVTTTGASLSLPLRMAAIGTGASVGITIWVVSDGRYEPQNFPFFHIEDPELVWDFSASLSNYTTLRAKKEAALGGKGWEIESSLALNEQLVSNVIASGGSYYGGGGFSNATAIDAAQDYLAVPASAGVAAQTAGDVRAADITALFAGMAGPTVRVTRMRSDIAHAAMTADFLLRASADQSELTNVRQVTQQVNLSCPIYGPTCSVIGTGTVAEAAAAEADAGVAGSVTGGDAGATASGGVVRGAADAGGGSPGVTDGTAPSSGGGGSGGGGGGGCAASSHAVGSAGAGFGLTALLGLGWVRRRRGRDDGTSGQRSAR